MFRTRALMTTALAAGLICAAPLAAQDQSSEGQDAQPQAEEQQRDVTADTVVARVGDTEITMGHVVTIREQLPQQYQQLPDDVLFEGIVNQLVDQHLLSLGVTEAELSKRAQLQLDNELRGLKANQRVMMMLQETVTDKEVQEVYDATYANAEPEKEYNASHILVETEEEAQALIAELEGGADFAELAKEKSTGPSGPNGGQLGWFGKGTMVPEFQNAVEEMETGEVAGPVQTQFGWHVIKLNETRDKEPPSLDDVKAEIVGQLNQEAIEALLEELREDAVVEVMTDGIPAGAFRSGDILAE
jgi:peptidyl-prolyl cis-trans isomerase C